MYCGTCVGNTISADFIGDIPGGGIFGVLPGGHLGVAGFAEPVQNPEGRAGKKYAVHQEE